MVAVNAGLAREHPNSGGNAHLISGNAQRWRREFSQAVLDPNEWKIVNGQLADTTSGQLVVTPGLDPIEFSITSKRMFTAPLTVSFSVAISAKQANQNVWLELVAVVPGSEDYVVDEEVVASWRIGQDSPASSTTTTMAIGVRNGPPARIEGAASSSAAVISSTTPIGLYTIQVETDETWFFSQVTDSTGSKSSQFVRQQTSPDPTREFMARIRVTNTGTVTAQTMRFGHVVVSDYTEMPVEITTGRGGHSAAQGVPVNIAASSPTVLTTAGLTSTTSSTVNTAKVNSAASTNATLAGAGTSTRRLLGWQLSNLHATAWRYVKIFNKATAPVAGTDTPILVIPIPPLGHVDLAVPFGGVSVTTGFGYTITGGPADNDATAVGLNEVIGSLYYA